MTEKERLLTENFKKIKSKRILAYEERQREIVEEEQRRLAKEAEKMSPVSELLLLLCNLCTGVALLNKDLFKNNKLQLCLALTIELQDLLVGLAADTTSSLPFLELLCRL
ncbi:hypothetical protein L7F22_041067 [Adiantum nelumboides]|nr:hypothetical protein [Adiantum nelumboides]